MQPRSSVSPSLDQSVTTDSKSTSQQVKDKPHDLLSLTEGAVSASALTGFVHLPDTLQMRWVASNLTREEALQNRAKLRQVLFQDTHDKPAFPKPGLAFRETKLGSACRGIGYNLTNRTVQFIWLTYVTEITKQAIEESELNSFYQRMFGPKWAKIAEKGTAGVVAGTTEILTLPIEVLKTRVMVNLEVANQIKQQGLWTYVITQRTNLWKAPILTLTKNMVGTGSFFAFDEMMKLALGVKDSKMEPFKALQASFVSSIASTAITTPLEVIRTRVQAHHGPAKAVDFVRGIESRRANMRGMFTKCAIQGTKRFLLFGPGELLSDKFMKRHEEEKQAIKLKGYQPKMYKSAPAISFEKLYNPAEDAITQKLLLPPI